MKGLIAFDIDGTLTHKLDWIDPKVVIALDDLTKKGWQIALLTGRIFSFAFQILKFLSFPYFLAVQNGADILSMPSKKILKRNYLSSGIIPKIEKAYQGQSDDFIIYAGIDEGDFCYFRRKRFTKKRQSYLKVLEEKSLSPWRLSDFHFEKEKRFPLIKCFGEKGAMEKVYNALKMDPDIAISLIRDPVDPSLYLNLITHPKANKGDALHYIKQSLNAPFVIAAGDDHNDLNMLNEANVSIAIETAPEEVLGQADIIAKKASDLGILDALEKALHLS